VNGRIFTPGLGIILAVSVFHNTLGVAIIAKFSVKKVTN
jgi:hypothetical protein